MKKSDTELYNTYLRKRSELEAKGYNLTELMTKEQYSEIYHLAKLKGMPNIAREVVKNERVISYNQARAFRKSIRESNMNVFQKLKRAESKAEIKRLRRRAQEMEYLKNASIRDILQYHVKFNPDEEVRYKLKNKYTGKTYKGTYKMTERKALYMRLKEYDIDTKSVFGY